MSKIASPVADLAAKIDHTLLKPTLIQAEIDVLCQEAATHHFKTVCVPPTWVETCVQLLKGTGVGTITVVGFPLGYASTESKCLEAKVAIDQGASEIDMVINLSWLKSGKIKDVEADIRAVAAVCIAASRPLKVIIETAYLSDAEKISVALAAERAGATFVKTSTGFASGVPITGATLADIQLLRKTLNPKTLIKASGGIRDLATAQALVDAGADRLGTSSGIAILKGLTATGAY